MSAPTPIRVLGVFLIVGGLGAALTFGGNEGFTNGPLVALAYIVGFLTAFVGVYLAFILGREKKTGQDEFIED